MPNRIVIEVSETDHGFVASIPGTPYKNLFGPTIPGALRRLGSALSDGRARIANSVGRFSYSQQLDNLAFSQSDTEME